MGVVTARAAGVEEVVVCAPGAHPVILAACALCGVDEVYAMGGAHAVAALAYGTETIARVDVIAGPGNLYVQEAKRLVSGDVGHRRLPGPSDVLVLAAAGADPALVALDLLAQAEHGEGTIVARGQRRRRRCSTRSATRLDAPGDGGGRGAASTRPTLRGGARPSPRRSRPSTSSSSGAAAEALAPRVRSAGCVFVGARERRRRSATTSPARTTRCRPAARRASPPALSRAALPPAHEPRCASATRPARWRAPARRSPGPRASRVHAASMEARAENARADDAARAEIARKTKETDVAPAPGARRHGRAATRATGVGFLDHMLDLLARHGRLDLDVAVTGDLRDRRAPHGRGHRASSLGQALDQALGDRAGIYRYGHAVVPMDEARAACAIDISGRPFLRLRGRRCRRASPAASTTS